jgi:hypothetical protein
MAKAKKETQEDVKEINFDELNALADEISAYLEKKMGVFEDVKNLGRSLTGRERLRLYGMGNKNYGFIKSAFDVASGNPQFMPAFFDFENFRKRREDYVSMQQLVIVLRQSLEAAETAALLESDALYHDALSIYGHLRELTRRRVVNAADLFAVMRPFFNRPKRSGGPTQKELERDFKKVLRGEAEGEITVVNESPVIKAGKRMVIDRVGKDKSVVISE